jgi:hypothetical protein
MKTITLPPDTRRETRATHKAIFDYADVAALGAGTTGNFNILQKPAGTGVNVPAGFICEVISVHIVTTFDFSDAGITSLAMTIGDSGSNARLLASQELAADGTYITDKVGVAGGNAYTSATAVNAYFTVANGGSPLLNECTSGKAEIYFSLRSNDLTRPQ